MTWSCVYKFLRHPLKKLLELTNEFSKFAGYKINIQKQIVFQYACNEKSENEIKKTISFIIHHKE